MPVPQELHDKIGQIHQDITAVKGQGGQLPAALEAEIARITNAVAEFITALQSHDAAPDAPAPAADEPAVVAPAPEPMPATEA